MKKSKLSINELRTVMDSSDDRTSKARQVTEIIRKSGNYRWVGVYDVTNDEIAIIAWSGVNAPAFPRFPVSQGLNGACVSAKQSVIANDVSKDARYLTTFGNTRSEIVVPVLGTNRRNVVGTIDVESQEKDAFGEADKAFLEECSKEIVRLWGSASV
jgi:putative methionine-R-sulfoxide reductase with GAF domain